MKTFMILFALLLGSGCSVHKSLSTDQESPHNIAELLEHLSDSNGVYWDYWTVYSQQKRLVATTRYACYRTEGLIKLYQGTYIPGQEAGITLLVFTETGDLLERRFWIKFRSGEGEWLRDLKKGDALEVYDTNGYKQSRVYRNPKNAIPEQAKPAILQAAHKNSTLLNTEFTIVGAYGQSTSPKSMAVSKMNCMPSEFTKNDSVYSLYSTVISDAANESGSRDVDTWILDGNGLMRLIWLGDNSDSSYEAVMSIDQIKQFWEVPKEMLDISTLGDQYWGSPHAQ